MQYRKKANTVLAIVFVLFLTAVALRYFLRGLLLVELLYAVAEAALIGGLADWFAVTALFKKPLGFAWHTAIIPRNRMRIIAAVAGTVEQDLFNMHTIKTQLQRVRFVDAIIDWIDSEAGKAFFKKLVFNYMQQLVLKVDVPTLAKYLDAVIKGQVVTFELAPQIKIAIQWALAHGKDEQFIDFVLNEIEHVAGQDSTRDALYDIIKGVKKTAAAGPFVSLIVWVAEQTDSLNLREFAAIMQQDLLILLQKLKTTDHPLRVWLKKQMHEAIVKLGHDPKWVDKIEAWKADTLKRMQFDSLLLKLIDKTIALTKQSLVGGSYHSPLIIWVLGQLDKYWEFFKQNGLIQDLFEAYIKQAVYRIVETEHSFIGIVIKQALSQLSDQDLSSFIEEKVGDDLAWIRINGSVVGGIVGLVMFLFLHIVYGPYVVPVIRALAD